MIDLNQLVQLHEKATPGLWELDTDGSIADLKILSPWIEDAWLGDVEAESNMALIAALRNALPEIIAELEHLRAENTELRRTATLFTQRGDGCSQIHNVGSITING